MYNLIAGKAEGRPRRLAEFVVEALNALNNGPNPLADHMFTWRRIQAKHSRGHGITGIPHHATFAEAGTPRHLLRSFVPSLEIDGRVFIAQSIERCVSQADCVIIVTDHIGL
jgi:hypothetical protein